MCCCGCVREPRAAAEDVEALRAAVARQRREPPLGWPALVAWEARHKVVLPEPYRSFVAEIANGCSLGLFSNEGPLLPPGRLPESWHRWASENWLSPEPFDSQAPRDPSAPFPLAEEWQWEYDFDPDEHVALMSFALPRRLPHLGCRGTRLVLGTGHCRTPAGEHLATRGRLRLPLYGPGPGQWSSPGLP